MPPDDFSVSNTSVTFHTAFGAGATKCITVTGIPDMVAEGTEFMSITIQPDTMQPPRFLVSGTDDGFAEQLTLIYLDDDAEGNCDACIILEHSIHH